MKPRVIVLTGYGINCDYETEYAFTMPGVRAKAERVHVNELIESKANGKSLKEYDVLAIPGGFSFGDHLAAGRIFAIDLIHRIQDQLLEVRAKKIPVIGICNGFQVLVQTGLLPGTGEIGKPNAVLDRNMSAKFESRWIEISLHIDDHMLLKERTRATGHRRHLPALGRGRPMRTRPTPHPTRPRGPSSPADAASPPGPTPFRPRG